MSAIKAQVHPRGGEELGFYGLAQGLRIGRGRGVLFAFVCLFVWFRGGAFGGLGLGGTRPLPGVQLIL